MGASPYWYIVPLEDPKAALKKLRNREFKAGRYYPAVENLRFPIAPKSPAPGAQHKSINEAVTAAEDRGTQSILDIGQISHEPEFLAATLVSDEQLAECFGTNKPNATQFDGLAKLKLLAKIKRGHAVYFPLYHAGKRVELLFAGYSCD